jgi:imidazolonepropionase-like amidohydrolase
MTRIEFRGVRLIDGVADSPQPAMDIVVGDGRVVAVRPTAERRSGADPAGPETVIEGRGLTLLPGLIDAHAHYTFDPTEGDLGVIRARSDEEILSAAARHAERALRAGVTSARGAGAIRDLDLRLRDDIERGETPGPRLITAGLAVGAPGGHGHQFGVEAEGETALVEAVRARAAAGADLVKVVSSAAAMLTTTGLAPDVEVFGEIELSEPEIAAIVNEAHHLGLRVMSHAQDSESVIASARAGVDSVEHAWLAAEVAIEAIAAAGAVLVPTLVVTDVNRTLPGLTPVQRARQDLIEGTHRASCEAAIRLGVPIVAGTDTGEVGVTADMVWREVALIRDHGASPMAAVKAATSVAARLLGIDRSVGTIEVGKAADLILVAGDPLADLRRLAEPAMVVQAGRVVVDRRADLRSRDDR